jgi:hypothetical protein
MKSKSSLSDGFRAVLGRAGGSLGGLLGFSEKPAVTGVCHLVLRGADGRVKEARTANTVCTAAKNGMAENLLASPSGYPKPGWMAIGTGSPTGTGEADKLGGEVARVALTSKTRTGAVVTMIGDYAAGVPATEQIITEAGIFDVVTADTVKMWCSASFGAITKGVLDTLQITWTLTVS